MFGGRPLGRRFDAMLGRSLRSAFRAAVGHPGGVAAWRPPAADSQIHVAVAPKSLACPRAAESRAWARCQRVSAPPLGPQRTGHSRCRAGGRDVHAALGRKVRTWAHGANHHVRQWADACLCQAGEVTRVTRRADFYSTDSVEVKPALQYARSRLVMRLSWKGHQADCPSAGARTCGLLQRIMPMVLKARCVPLAGRTVPFTASWRHRQLWNRAIHGTSHGCRRGPTRSGPLRSSRRGTPRPAVPRG
jgi:hypothetical protein